MSTAQQTAQQTAVHTGDVVHAKDHHIIGLSLNDTTLNSLLSKLGILSISIL